MRNATWVLAVLSAAGAVAGQAGAYGQGLVACKAVEHGLLGAGSGPPLPEQAVRVYVYEGAATQTWVNADTIAVQYMHSGVLFDRKTGQLVRRFTIADGWPKERPKEFLPAPPDSRRQDHLVGPGVLEAWRESRPLTPPPTRRPAGARTPVEPAPVDQTHAPAASCEFDGRLWQALQPVGFFQGLYKRLERYTGINDMRHAFGTWTSILEVANSESFVTSRPLEGQGKTIRYTMTSGLASNLVTHLAASDGKLWAACVDIYDPKNQRWGPGGLCCLDAKKNSWRRIDKIEGHPVRWVTLLQTEGKELWVGFREGDGVAGDSVAYGMGLYPGQYRPIATVIVLARLSRGKWTVFSRPPMAAPSQADAAIAARATSRAATRSSRPASPSAPGETPRTLAVVVGKVFLFSQSQSRALGNWDTEWEGYLSMLDLASGKWREFDVDKDFAAHELERMAAQDGELLALTDQGVVRWLDKEGKWSPLDGHSTLANPNISEMACVGKELWVGYTNQSFGILGRQGISRFNEETMTWSYTDPNEIGTACPVKTIVPLGESSALVLFRQRDYFGAAMEFPFYPRQRYGPAGLGRFAAGKWEFPVHLEGVPESITRSRQGPNGPEQWEQKLQIDQLVSAGGKVFVSNAAGVFEGPGKWRRILEFRDHSYDRHGLQTSPDGKTLQVWQRGKRTDYELSTGKTTDTEISEKEYADVAYAGERYAGRPPLSQDWGAISGLKMPGSWTLGSIDDRNRRVVKTPWAFWVASSGQLIRLDRKFLPGEQGKRE